MSLFPQADTTAVSNVVSVGGPTLTCFLREREEGKMGKEDKLEE